MFFKLGMFSFGGGYTMVSIIQKQLEAYGWITAVEYADIVTISQMTPGPLAVNVGTFIGAKLLAQSGVIMSVIGSIMATFGVALPSFILVVLAAKLYDKIYTKKQTQWVMNGIRPAVIGLLANAVVFFSGQSIFSAGAFSKNLGFFDLNFSAIAIFLLILFLSLKTKIGAITLILISAVIGIFIM